MRWDEHGWDNYSPATLWDIKAGIDANGKLVALDATSTGMASYSKTPTEIMVGQTVPTTGNGPADTTYSGTQYDIPNRRVTGKTVSVLNNYFKVSTLRAPNAMQTCFASEQVIDHLAGAGDQRTVHCGEEPGRQGRRAGFEVGARAEHRVGVDHGAGVAPGNVLAQVRLVHGLVVDAGVRRDDVHALERGDDLLFLLRQIGRAHV